MGTMNKLRENTAVILWILVISFGVIWVLQDSGAFDAIGNTTGTNIIVVDGDAITYDQYSQALDAQLQQYQAQSGEPMQPQMVDMTRDRVFDQLVEAKLLEHEMDRLGIKVTDDEVYQMVLGDNPHPIIKMYFGDQQGQINEAYLRSVIDDPEAREQWRQLEDYLRNERRRQKLNNLIAASVRVSDQDVIEEYVKRNRNVNARYVALRYADIPDDSVQVTESDLKKFYSDHREDFERKRTFSVEYVALSKNPTAQDTSLIVSELDRLRPRFETAEDDSVFLSRNASERPYSDAYFRADELEPSIAEAVFSNLQPGAVISPFVAGNEAHLIKIKDVRPAEETAVRARHILFRAPEGNTAERAEALKRAQEVKQRIQQGESFAAMAREFSADPGSAAKEGDLGWFGKGRMVEPFENAAFNARAGQVVGPVETQYGYHLIEVTQRADQEVQLADFVMQVRADIATLNSMEEQLDDFQYYAEESGDFSAEAQRRNLPVQQVQIEADQEMIPDLGNSRSILNFLEDSEEGAVSKVIELDDQFVVLHVQEIQPEGFRSFEEVRAELEPRVRIEKKKGVQEARLRNALEKGNFESLAPALGVSERNAGNINFNNPVIPGLGREPKFAGTALGMKEGQVSDVIAGENAAYVIKATEISEPAPITQQLLNQRRTTVMNQWLTSLREKADVIDRRRSFQQ